MNFETLMQFYQWNVNHVAGSCQVGDDDNVTTVSTCKEIRSDNNNNAVGARGRKEELALEKKSTKHIACCDSLCIHFQAPDSEMVKRYQKVVRSTSHTMSKRYKVTKGRYA